MSRRDYISVEKIKNEDKHADGFLSYIIRYRYLVPTGLLDLGLLLRIVF